MRILEKHYSKTNITMPKNSNFYGDCFSHSYIFTNNLVNVI